MLDGLAKEMAHRFGLGASANPLLNAYLNMIETEWSGGWTGYLAHFRNLGYGIEVANWLGNGPNQTITAEAIEEVFGMPALEQLSERTGVNLRTCSEALAYATPEIVDTLTPQGVLPSSMPGWAAGVLQPSSHRATTPVVIADSAAERVQDSLFESNLDDPFDEPSDTLRTTTERALRSSPLAGWTTPLALGAIVLMISWAATRQKPASPVAANPAQSTETRVLSDRVERAPSQLAPPVLLLNQTRGGFSYKGVVRDQNEKDKLEATLRKLGATGELEVDLGVGDSNWTDILGELLREAPRGLVISIEGKSITLSGLSADRLAEQVTLVQDRLTDDYTVGVLDLTSTATAANEASQKSLQALATQKTITIGAWLEAVNKMVINFRSGAVSIPEANKALLDRAAELLLKINSTETIAIGGFTDSTGSASGNLRLSQRRADEVRNYLISQGVPEDRLLAKGFGAENPIASNETAQGRFANRRIEFSINPAPAQ